MMAGQSRQWTHRVLLALPIGALAVVVGLFFLGTETGQRLDASTFGAVVALREEHGPWTDRIRMLSTAGVATLFLLAVIVALVSRAWRAVVVVIGAVLLVLLVSTVLRDFVIVRPYLGEYGYLDNTFPSGHAAVAVAALSTIPVLVPRVPTVVVAILAAVGGATGLAQVVSYAHRASDVFAGALLAALVVALVADPTARRRGAVPIVLGVCAALAVLGGGALLASWELGGYAPELGTGAAAGIGLGVAGVTAAASAVAMRARPVSGAA